jgi:glutamate synthase (NADPH/NADH) small chain
MGQGIKMRKNEKKPRSQVDPSTRRETIGSSSACIQCQEPGCTGGCPIGVGVPSVLSLTSSGRLKEAATLLRLRSPLASIAGRLCPSSRFCEHACVLARKGAPVSVHAIETFLGDASSDLPVKRGRTAMGKILVVGSGPAGLLAAHDLHADGFEVRVFEREALAGGCLRHLPTELLPAGILDSEVDRLAKSGIAFETSRPFEAKDGFPPGGYSAVVLTTGPPGPYGSTLPLKHDAEGFIVVDPNYRASLPRVYAAGGAISRFDNITEAMASARELVGHLVRAYLFPPLG